MSFMSILLAPHSMNDPPVKRMAKISEKEALLAYARMLNTYDSSEFESLLSEELSFSSQAVFSDINSKNDYIGYIRKKLESIKNSDQPVYAELGILPCYGHQDCVVIAQGNKSNLVGVAYISTTSHGISQISLCTVPSPYEAKRSGVYPGLDEHVRPRTFISYANDYDYHIGSKKWNELDLEMKIEILKIEFLRTETNGFSSFHDAVIRADWKKAQAQGLRSLLVSVQMLYEKMGIIPGENLTSTHYDKILSFFKGKTIYKEFDSLLSDGSESECEYDGVELERLAFSLSQTSPLDNALDMTIAEARSFILSFLEDEFDKQRKSENRTISDLEFNSEKIPLSRFVSSEAPSRSFLSSLLRYGFVCSEVKWICDEINFFFDSYDFMIKEEALKSATKIAKDSDSAKFDIRVNRLKPKQIAILIIKSVSKNSLLRGRLHVYRGVLNLIGQEYLKLYTIAANDAVRLGFDKKEEADAEIAELRTAIGKVG